MVPHAVLLEGTLGGVHFLAALGRRAAVHRRLCPVAVHKVRPHMFHYLRAKQAEEAAVRNRLDAFSHESCEA